MHFTKANERFAIWLPNFATRTLGARGRLLSSICKACDVSALTMYSLISGADLSRVVIPHGRAEASRRVMRADKRVPVVASRPARRGVATRAMVCVDGRDAANTSALAAVPNAVPDTVKGSSVA